MVASDEFSEERLVYIISCREQEGMILTSLIDTIFNYVFNTKLWEASQTSHVAFTLYSEINVLKYSKVYLQYSFDKGCSK